MHSTWNFQHKRRKLALHNLKQKWRNNLSDDLHETARWPNRSSKTQIKPQHKTRIRSARKTETFNSDIFDVGRLPTSETPHMCQETRWRKTKTHPTRAMPSGTQLIQGCHTVIPKTSTQTHLSRTPRMLRKKPQKVSGDVFHLKNQLMTCASTDILSFTHSVHKNSTKHTKETRKNNHALGTASHTSPIHILPTKSIFEPILHKTL